MKRLKTTTAALLVVLGATAATNGTASGALPSPAWNAISLSLPTNFIPGDKKHDFRYKVLFRNVGAAPTDGSPIVITDTLPAGITVKSLELPLWKRTATGMVNADVAPSVCSTATVSGRVTVTCTLSEESLSAAMPTALQPAVLQPERFLDLTIHVSIPKSISGSLLNEAEIQGGGAAPSAAESAGEASAAPAMPGFAAFQTAIIGPDGVPVGQAGGRAFNYVNRFAVNTEFVPGDNSKLIPTGGDIKDIEVRLPPGLIGDPLAAPRCTPQQFNTLHSYQPPEDKGSNYFMNDCPDASAVGTVLLHLEGFGTTTIAPVYNLVPPKGMPAQFGFGGGLAPVYLNTRVRTGGDYGVTVYLKNTSEAKRITFAETTFWGTSAADVHDPVRGECAEPERFECPAGVEPQAFWRLPTSCASPMANEMSFNGWLNPAELRFASETQPAPSGCSLPPFEPTVEARPTTNVADAPTGLEFDLHLPQHRDPESPAEADLKDAVVTLPPGLVVNPASADGLAACSEAELNLAGSGQPQCPEASKLGTVQVTSPLVDHPLPGAVYLAAPRKNPFGSLIAIYITVSDPQTGVVIKLAGEVKADAETGQLRAIVRNNPQLPFEDFELDFFPGARASLRTPAVCGAYSTSAELTPHTAPESGAPATRQDSFATASAPGGGVCPASPASQPADAAFTAGTVSPVAGAFSPFALRLTREDGSQEVAGLDVALPPGLLGRLTGVAECSDAALAAAATRPGAAERATPVCPGNSRLGTVTVGAGAGPSPFHVQGSAYLAGPYKGAPLSVAVITPALAGPFDLGVVVVRAALHVDPETTQVNLKSDPIPRILEGIPLDIRSIQVDVDRARFTLNPTNCDAMGVTGAARSVLGQTIPLSNRFQVGGCADLRFKPRLSLRLRGGTDRADHPSLQATLTMPAGGANIARAQVGLPRSLFLDQGSIGTVCTRVQFAASQCPPRSVYGQATAFSPLLDEPLRGPVYLRSSSNPLPDLVADLNGRIRVALSGRIDTSRGGIRTTFEAVPDAPVSKFLLTIKGGKKKGLLENSTNLCAGQNRARVQFTAQNGKSAAFRTPLKSSCRKRSQRRGSQ